MNEYDSDKMADVLAAADGFEPTATPEDADLILFNTCSVREKAQENVFGDLGRVRALKAGAARRDDRRRRLRREPGRRGDRRRAPYVDLVFGPQTLHRLPELIARRRATGVPQVDISFPEIEKFDHLPPPARRGRRGVRLDHGRLQQVLHLLRRALHARRGSLAAVRRRAGRSRRPRRPGRARGHAARPERQRVSRQRDGDGDGAIADFAPLLEHVAEIPGIERIRYTTSHPKEFTQRLIDVVRRRVASSSTHLHLPVQSGSDRVLAAMKRGYTALEYKSIVRRLRAARPGLSLIVGLHRRLPRRDRRRFRADAWSSIDDVGFDGASASSTARGPARRRRSSPTRCRTTSKQARLQRLQALLDAQYRAHSAAMVGTRQRVLVTGRAVKDAARACRPHRQQPRRQLRRRRGARRPLRRRRHHAALPHSLRGDARRRRAREPRRVAASERSLHSTESRMATSSAFPSPAALATLASPRSPCPAALRCPPAAADAAKSPSRRDGGGGRDCRDARGARPSPARRRSAPVPRAAPSAPATAAGAAAAAAAPRRRPEPFAEVIKDAKETPGLFHALPEGRQGLDRARARPVRQAVLLLVEPEPRAGRAVALRRADGRQRQSSSSTRSATSCSCSRRTSVYFASEGKPQQRAVAEGVLRQPDRRRAGRKPAASRPQERAGRGQRAAARRHPRRQRRRSSGIYRAAVLVRRAQLLDREDPRDARPRRRSTSTRTTRSAA